ncbi:hypothetical protein KVR01_013778 [Diaporthe batatas]|uniref:uncharacterized protein n=1 Tax=Diaporthe batatas TaxID=748121 RepID=UPI001D037316|nr:uncharacterized protein KVR01_013778 [Diaporthe batatas]KAG8156326.1 hypothetical protein KVR01_013778 [Diaporthe batatas]
MGNNLYVTLDAGKTGNFLGALNSYLQQYAHALNANLGAYYCTWTSLYIIKLSFMVFFHGLGNNFRAQKFVWWGVLIVIVACYIVSVAMFDYGCLTADWKHIITKCASKETMQYEFTTARVSTALDVLSDALIVVVPSHVVWKSMLPLRKKLVLVAVCSLTLFMMICAIIRIGVGMKDKLTDLSWFLTWNSVEMTLGKDHAKTLRPRSQWRQIGQVIRIDTLENIPDKISIRDCWD